MTQEDIVKRLTNKRNFKKSVKFCLEANIDISCILFCFPEFNIYHYKGEYETSVIDQTSNGDNSAYWFQPHPTSLKNGELKFYIKGKSEILSGLVNFFTYYDKIHTFVYKGEETLRVKFGEWYESKDSEHYELSYELHSETKPAFDTAHTKSYYHHGEIVPKKDFIKKSRELKLKRILKQPVENNI